MYVFIQWEERFLEREFKTVKTIWGPVKIKVGKYNGKVIQISPEYEECRKISKKKKIPVRQVYEVAQSEAINLFGPVNLSQK